MVEKTRDPAVARRFGDNLRRIRRRKGLSQEQLSVLASLHRTEIGLLETGGRIPRIDTLIQLAGALDVDTGELLKGIFWIRGGELYGSFAFETAAGRRALSRANRPEGSEARMG